MEGSSGGNLFDMLDYQACKYVRQAMDSKYENVHT